MAKKLILAASLLALTLPAGYASAGETGAGCGVGKMVMEGKEGKDANITAALINWVVNFQAFGMTSGTLGCDTTQQVNNEHARETFLASNSDSLSVEMAQGSGEHLTSLAAIMGIPSEEQQSFFDVLQANSESIISSDDMMASIDSTLLVDEKLSRYVR